MNFSNLILFQFPPMHGGTFADMMVDDGLSIEKKPSLLLEGAEELRAKPPGPMEVETAGFVPPYGSAASFPALVETDDTSVLITIEFAKRLLPAAAVADALHKRIDEHEARTGRRPGGRARRQMRDDVIAELLPKALIVRKRVDAIINPQLCLIAVGTASRRVAENVVSLVRSALGSFPALPVTGGVEARAVLTGWLSGDQMPEGLSIGHECTLEDNGDGGKVTIKDMELDGEEVTTHLIAGRRASRLALSLGDAVQFNLHDDLSLRKFQLGDSALASMEDTDFEDLRGELDARLAITAGAINWTFDRLTAPFRIERPQ